MRSTTFPPGFLWGAATSAYQVEGGWDADGKGPSIWDTFSHTPGAIADGRTGDVACDSFHRYPDDIALLRSMGLGAYRFSIAWARIFPDASDRVNAAGLAYYERLVDDLLAAGIEPFPTLYHWDLPQWLQDRGGWANREIVDRFARYAEVLVSALGDRVSRWSILNEPNVFVFHGIGTRRHAPGIGNPDMALRASHIVNLSVGAAMRAMRASTPAGRRLEIGTVVNMEAAYPASERAEDVAAAERYHRFLNAWFLDPLVRGTYPEAFLDQEAALARMDIRPGDDERLRTELDFIGLNLYRRGIVQFDPTDTAHGTRLVPGPGPRTSFDWEVWPAALYRMLRRLDADYDHPRIYVTENGCADATGPGADGRVHDTGRIAYYQGYVGQMARAIDEGCDVRGYLAWSLLDNFEWAVGFSQRFGLVYCDFENGQRRILKDSGAWLRELVAANRIDYDESLS